MATLLLDTNFQLDTNIDASGFAFDETLVVDVGMSTDSTVCDSASIDSMYDLFDTIGDDPTDEDLTQQIIAMAVPLIPNHNNCMKIINSVARTNRKVPEAKVKTVPRIAKKTQRNIESCNLMVGSILKDFKEEKPYHETAMFTEPVPTTFTVQGFFTNVDMHEEELVLMIDPTDDIIGLRCNYGKVYNIGYEIPVKVKRSNRGRHKSIKVKKPRKKQGTGDEFNSQLTFIVRSRNSPSYNGFIPDSSRVYKIKVFRTGGFQLPGVTTDCIDDVIECAKIVGRSLSDALHDGETECEMESLITVMKNYKFAIKKGDTQIIDLRRMEAFLKREMTLMAVLAAPTATPATQTATLVTQPLITPRVDSSPLTHNEPLNTNQIPLETYRPRCPNIRDVKFGKNTTKLSIRFLTPCTNNVVISSNSDASSNNASTSPQTTDEKGIRVNIFLKGKINILGASNISTTRQICDYLHWIFMNNRQFIVNTCPIPSFPRKKQRITRLPIPRDNNVNNTILPHDWFDYIALPWYRYGKDLSHLDRQLEEILNETVDV